MRIFARCEGGSALIETAVSLPVLCSMLFCFMEICLASYSRQLIAECAREGARYAIVHGSTCPTAASPTCEANAAAVNTYVGNIGLPNMGGGRMTVNTTYPDGNEAPGSRVKVTVTYSFPITMPFVPTNSLSLSSASEMYIIQ